MKRVWINAVVGLVVAFGIFEAYRAVKRAMEENSSILTKVDDNDAAVPYVGKLRFLALGDSYTIGEKVKPSERWPVQLAHEIRENRIDLSDPVIIAQTGWTTANLISAMDKAKVDSNYDLVMLLIGVNNQYQHRSIDEYKSEFAELLKRSITAAKGDAGHVIVLSIPDWGVMPFAQGSDRAKIGTEIDAFNIVAKVQCDAAHIPWVDVTPVSRTAASQPTFIAGDGLHPSGEQYARWVEMAIPVVQKAINVRR